MTSQRKITLSIKGNSYSAEFPTIGQFMRIESLKQQLTGGQYTSMATSQLSSQFEALEFVDIVSYFSILFPKISKDLNKVSFEEIDAIDFAEVRKEYREKFLPWINEWYQTLRNTGVESEKK